MNVCRILRNSVNLLKPSVILNPSSTSLTRKFVTLRAELFPQSNFFQISKAGLPTIQTAGLKHVNHPQRRCRHCYMVYEDERAWVFCDKYPRHKQVQRRPPREEKNAMIMTHATQGSKKRRNKGPRGGMHMLTQSGFRMDF